MPDDSTLPETPSGPIGGNADAGASPLAAPPQPGGVPDGTVAGPDGAGALGDAQGGGAGRPPKPTESAGVGHHWAWSDAANAWERTPNFRRRAAAPKPKRLVPAAAVNLAAALGMGGPTDAPADAGAPIAPNAEPPADAGSFVFAEADNRAFLAYVVEELENADKDRLVALAEAALVGTKHAELARSLGERFWAVVTTRPNERATLIDAFLAVLRDMEINVPPSARLAVTLLMAAVRRVKGYKDFANELAALKGAA